MVNNKESKRMKSIVSKEIMVMCGEWNIVMIVFIWRVDRARATLVDKEKKRPHYKKMITFCALATRQSDIPAIKQSH